MGGLYYRIDQLGSSLIPSSILNLGKENLQHKMSKLLGCLKSFDRYILF